MEQMAEKFDNKLAISQQIGEPSMEPLMQVYIQIEESESEARWTKGQLLYAMLADESLSQKRLSAQ